VQQDGRDDFQAFLLGQILLFGLLGTSLAFFLAHRNLHTYWSLPELRLVIQTAATLAAGIVALLAGVRFGVEGRRLDLLLCTGFLVASLSTLALSIAPVIGGQPLHRPEGWAGVVGRLFAWILIAAAPFMRGRSKWGSRVLGNACIAACVVLLLIWTTFHSFAGALPELASSNANPPPVMAGLLSAQALLNLLAVVGFGLRFREKGEDLDRWLGLGATLMLFASLHYLFTPLLSSDYVSQGDFLRVIAYGVLMVGAWRAIRFAEFGRAVAEERARVAREIHDGLAQYLFAVATHATMLETADDEHARAATIANLKEATTAAQQEARFAVLALSSASGTAPFDAALRRYIDFLTADGKLDVELEIDPDVWLAPDEQIEVFRIVQEGLGNVRKHANATRAEVVIGERIDGERFVSIRDDGEGFDGQTVAAGQGLKNIRSRAASIEGGFKLVSRPGMGTALEVVLRA
jgi:signal transduction histidine kinase